MCWAGCALLEGEACIWGEHFQPQQARNSASIVLAAADDWRWAKILPPSRFIKTPPLGPTADRKHSPQKQSQPGAMS